MTTYIPTLFYRPDPSTMYHTPSAILAYIVTQVHLPNFIRANTQKPPFQMAQKWVKFFGDRHVTTMESYGGRIVLSAWPDGAYYLSRGNTPKAMNLERVDVSGTGRDLEDAKDRAMSAALEIVEGERIKYGKL